MRLRASAEIVGLARQWVLHVEFKSTSLEVSDETVLFAWVNRALDQTHGNEGAVRDALGLDAACTIALCRAARVER